MFAMRVFSVIFFFFLLTASATAAPGDIDTSFNPPNGYVTFTSAEYGAKAAAVAIQRDGRILTVGSLFDGSQWAIFLLRYNSNGSRDSSFGDGGIAVYGSRDHAVVLGNAVVIQPDGKIVVAGESNEPIILRYNSNGMLDGSFGSGGIVRTGLHGRGADAVALDHDGKIVITGSGLVDEDYNIGLFVARYNTDGSPDSSFASAGHAFYDPRLTDSSPRIGLAIQSDGKILISGAADYGKSMLVLRYKINGRLDRTFGVGGVVTAVIGEVENAASSIALQDDEKIMVAGWTVNDTPSGFNREMAVLRFNSSGELDSTFGTGGLAITNFRDDTTPRALAVQQDGKIVITGSKKYYTTTLVMRLNGNGTVDGSFGQEGYATFLDSNGQSSGWAIALQTDKKIVVAGTVQNDLESSAILLRLSCHQTPSEIIIDNRDANTSQTGTWHLSKGVNPYGPDSVWSRNGSTFTWNFTPNETGAHSVSMWWSELPPGSTRTPADIQRIRIPVDIQHEGGTSRVYIYQQLNGGKWNPLGSYNFIKGPTYSIKITSQPGPSGTSADAVKIH